MKAVLAGAFGKLGTDILIELCKQGHEVVALDLVTKELEGYTYTAKKIDVTKPETLAGTMDGADVVISTVGLTGTSATITNYDIDLNGNINLLDEAKKAGVKNFVYISVIKADTAPGVPMLHAKYLFEEELKNHNLRDEVTLTGSFCIGRCNRVGVTVQVDDEIYTGITRESFNEFLNDKILAKLK